MERIFKELPIVFPFYELKENQNRYREDLINLNQYKLISPNNSLLPFQIEMPLSKGNAVKWEIIRCDGNIIDISNNLNLIVIYEFSDKKQAVYNGEILTFSYEIINEELNLPVGEYYTVFTFSDGSQYISEFFFVPFSLTHFVKVDFWNNKDIGPILYRPGFKQTIYLDTFVSQMMPEVEEETEKDGDNNEIPVFQKLMLKYKFIGVVPDFIKIALVSLQIHDSIYIYINDSRKGTINRAIINVTPHDDGGMNDVEVIFEDDILIKSSCEKNKIENNITTW